MAIVVDPTSFYVGLFLLLIMGFTINRSGGLKIAMWRLTGVKGFIRTEITPSGDAIRTSHKMKIVQNAVLPYYNLKGLDGQLRTWFVGGPRETARAFGMPNWVYNSKDSRALPLEHTKLVNQKVEEQVKEKQQDGTEKVSTRERTVPVVVAGYPADPLVVHAVLETKVVKDFNDMDKPPASKFKWGMMALVIGLTLIMAGIAAYYTYYFGINIACAVHAHGVNCA